MKAINVEDLPEPVAQAIEAVVRILRQQLRPRTEPRGKVKLPVRPGKVLTELHRAEIYGDRG